MLALDDRQQEALDLLLAAHDPDAPGRLGGYAGTGKTAVIGRAVLADPRLVVLVPTHRARMALARVGIQAQTIHSAIYDPVDPRSVSQVEAELEAARRDEQAAGVSGAPDAEERVRRFQRRIAELEKERSSDVTFRAREHADGVSGQRVVVDEASMVGGRLLADLQAAGPASLCLVGDPGQLPPVQDSDPFGSSRPNVVLEHVYRHDSWILDCVTAVREDDEPRAMRIAAWHGRLLETRGGTAPPARAFSSADDDEAAGTVELCWRRRTRRERNAAVTRAGRRRVCCERNPPSWLRRRPDGVGSLPRNGALGWHDPVQGAIELDQGGTVSVEGHRVVWDHELPESPGREDIRGRWLWAGGWCLTAHRAQGGQWPRVAVIDEHGRGGDERRRWLYTALSRAQDDLAWWV